MSRSVRTTPKCGITKAESEKDDKRQVHRADRRAVKSQLDHTDDPGAIKQHHRGSGVYNFAKDGKQWLKNPCPKDMRK
jgi:hypothetical protein